MFTLNSLFRCAIIFLLALRSPGFPFTEDLYEGNQCPLEDGSDGVCKKIVDCPSRLSEVMNHQRDANSFGRCGFDHDIEIVCCESDVRPKIGNRPSEKVCEEIQSDYSPLSREVDTQSNDITNKSGQVNPFIFNGIRAAKGEFPYMVALGYNNTDPDIPERIVYKCGGALISPKYVLTAAHCILSISTEPPQWVKLGSESLKSTAIGEFRLENTMVHPKYRRSQGYNDVGLAVMEETIRFTPTVRPICLHTRPFEESENNGNVTFIAIGFGAISQSVDQSENLMKTTMLRYVDANSCNDAFTKDSRIPRGIDNTMICAYDFNRTSASDTCQGDSGGPLLMQTEKDYILVGITSFGGFCSSTGSPGVYTSVSSYLNWIEENVWPQPHDSERI